MKRVQRNLDHPRNQTNAGHQLDGQQQTLLAASDNDGIDVLAKEQIRRSSENDEEDDGYARNLEIVEKVHQANAMLQRS